MLLVRVVGNVVLTTIASTTTMIKIIVITVKMIVTIVVANLCLHCLCQANAESPGEFLKSSCCQQHAQLMTTNNADSNTWVFLCGTCGACAIPGQRYLVTDFVVALVA